MKTRILAIAAVAALSQAAQASDGTITFTGQLNTATCTITGGGNQTVTLPTLSTAALTSAGATAGDTLFNIAVTGCTAGLTTANAYFEAGGNIDTATGRLKNTAATNNVQIQLLNGSGTVVNLAGVAGSQNTAAATLTSGAGTQSFIARYYATGATTAGAVASSVTYSMVYN
jgi:major type 1 subunit fimbrin (pilin)